MRRVVLLGLLALLTLALPIAASATTCSAGFAITAGSSCTMGDLTFNFTSVSSVPTGDKLVLIAGTGITGNDANLEIQIGPVAAADITLEYTVTSTASNITGIDAGYVGAPGSSIDEVACGVAPVPPGCSDVLATLLVTNPNTNQSSLFGTTVSTVFIDKDVSSNGSSEFGDSILQTVPEPSTLGLLGTGLVGLAGMVRRKLRG